MIGSWIKQKANIIFGASLLLLMLASADAYAQQPYFRQVRLPEALSSTTVNCLYQDNVGKIWLGTGKGLFRYDGKSFLQVPVTPGNIELQISAIFQEKSGKMWIGTRKGPIYNLAGDSLVPFQPQEGLPKKAITGFATDSKGNLWFSTYGEGLYYFNGRYLYNLSRDDGLTDDFCYGIKSDKYGRIWAATDEGISVCYASGRLKKVDRITTDQGLPDNIVLSVEAGENGTFWVGMQDGGIASVNSSSMKVTVPAVSRSWNYGPVRDILPFNDIIWATSDNNGILEFDPASPRKVTSYHSGNNFELTKINGLMTDSQGNCWITTNNDLIFSAGPGFKYLKSISDKPIGNVQSILTDHAGNVWYSNEGHLFRFNPGENTGKNIKQFALPALSHTHIISLYEDTLGYIWAGTFGNGVLRVNPNTGAVRIINEKDGLTNGNVLSITGRGKDIWLATLGGAYHCLLQIDSLQHEGSLIFTNYNQKSGPGNNYIYSVFIDCKRRVWFGTDGKGISVLEGGRFTSYGEKDGIASKVVYSITEDPAGNIWFTTSTAGVYSFDGKKFRHYTTADGLSDNQISCIASDRFHHVLFANDRGIDILDLRSGTFTYYGSEVGLESIEPDLNVISGDDSGLFWIGTREGMIRIECSKYESPKRPALSLDKVSVFLSRMNFIGTHDFTYDQNHLTFFFNAAWYMSPDLVTYQYKMEGYDLDWISTRDNLTTYSSLPPGKYIFRFRAALRGNFANSTMLSYQFVIHKPFWKTWWFILIAAILLILLVYFIIRIRDARFKKSEIQKRENLLFQFQTLRSQVNPHFLFNSFSTLISVIDEDKDVAIEYVQKLSQFFRNILEYRDKDLITLGEELGLIETYRYLQHQRYGENFTMEITIPEEQLNTYIPPLTLQMLVENAIKHNVVSPEKPLHVKLYSDDKHLFVINNLQRKKLVESSTGLGLENISNRYKLMGSGGIVIRETASEFIIQLPLIQP